MTIERKVYFQWQNEALCKTIYPLRTMNLRNALEYFQEIDLWKAFKGKKVEDMPGEVSAYHQKMSAVLRQARKEYETQLAYFKQSTFVLDEMAFDKTLGGRIVTLHDSFNKYYDDKNPLDDPVAAVRRSYFITQRLETLDRDRKELDKQVSTQIRYLNLRKAVNEKNKVANDPRIAEISAYIMRLQALQPVFEERREHLLRFLAAFGRLDGHRKSNDKLRRAAQKKVDQIQNQLNPLEAQLKVLNARLAKAREELTQVARNLLPVAEQLVDNYFAVPDALTNLSDRFPQADPAFCARVDSLREQVAVLTDPATIIPLVNQSITMLQQLRVTFQRQGPSPMRDVTLKAFDEVVAQLRAFMTGWENLGKNRPTIEASVNRKKQEVARLEGSLVPLVQKQAELEQGLADPDLFVLEAHEDLYIPIPPQMKDIIRLKLDAYIEEELKVKVRDAQGVERLVDKDQYQLLEMLIARFKNEPERFPRWLQYMIVHFSGMRYASSHGSWADPRELYLNLRISIINEAWSKDKVQDEAFETIRQKKIAEYSGALDNEKDPDHMLPRLVTVMDRDEAVRTRVLNHLTNLKKDDEYAQRIGFINLLLDEEACENEEMTEEQALSALEKMRAEEVIPDWMWKELSAVTDLRLTEAKDTGWEKLTPEEQAEKVDAKWAKQRQIMNDWKSKYVTSWRQEHIETHDLIVSRAVCNEVAEHILHMRGHKGFSGLSGGADWFLGAAKKAAATDAEGAYFVKPNSAKDFRPGAGIMWLRYRTDAVPPWNLVKPFPPPLGRGGEPVPFFPSAYLAGGQWNYKDKNGLVRTRSVTDEKSGRTKPIVQNLYWVHIATVAEVYETDSKETIVLTYETNLPYEDRRLSCVGVFRRSLHNLLYDGGEDMYNGSLVGYVPDNTAAIPTADLDEMLNWDHILLKD